MKIAAFPTDLNQSGLFEGGRNVKLYQTDASGVVFDLDFLLPEDPAQAAGFLSGMGCDAVILKEVTRESAVSLNNARIKMYLVGDDSIDQGIEKIITGGIEAFDPGDTGCSSCDGCPASTSCGSYHENAEFE